MKKWVECLRNIEGIGSTLAKEDLLFQYFSSSLVECNVLENIFDLHLNYKINSFITDVKVLGRDLESFYYTINYEGKNEKVESSEVYFNTKIYHRLNNKTLKFLHDDNSYRFSKGEWIDTLLGLATCCHSEGEFNFYIRAITKDLKIGASIKIYNKVAKKLGMIQIPEYECMKVHDISEADIDFKSGAYVSLKLDGVNATFYGGQLYSRNGQVIALKHIEDYFNTLKTSNSKLVQNIANNFVFCGELVSSTRQSSSGLCNSAIKLGYDSKLDVSDLKFHIFDVVRKEEYESGKGEDTFKDRLEHYINMLCLVHLPSSPYIEFVDHKLVYSKDEAFGIYEEVISDNLEGIIINDRDGLYEKKRSKKRARIKVETTNEFEILSWEPHKRNNKWVGSIKVKSACGKIISDVGSGFTDMDRDTLFNDKDLIGKICEIKYNSIIRNSNSDGHTLFLPVFIKIREDKNEADSFNI